MPGDLDARYRVYVHNPPSDPNPGHPAQRFQHGPYRMGSMEWRTNDYDRARRKAGRIATGKDKDNTRRPGGWVSIQENTGGRWVTLDIIEAAT